MKINKIYSVGHTICFDKSTLKLTAVTDTFQKDFLISDLPISVKERDTLLRLVSEICSEVKFSDLIEYITGIFPINIVQTVLESEPVLFFSFFFQNEDLEKEVIQNLEQKIKTILMNFNFERMIKKEELNHEG